MKIKLFIRTSGQMGAVTENNDKFYPNKDESYDEFENRVCEEIRAKYLEEAELEITDESKLKKRATKDLLKKIKTSKGTEQTIIAEILEGRGVKFTKTEKPVEEQKTTTKEKEEPRKRSPKITDKESIDLAKKAKQFIGKKIDFLCTKTKKMESGTVKRIRRDPRSNMVVYMILVEEGEVKGQIFGKTVWSEDLKIHA